MVAKSDLKAFVGSEDYEISLNFYTALGFEINWNEGRLAEIETPGGRFLLQDYYNQEWCENMMLHLSVDDVDGWFEKTASMLRDNEFPGARVNAPRAEDYGARVAYLWDPSGILWHIAQYDTNELD